MNYPLSDELITQIDEQRTRRGFLRVAEMLHALTQRGNVILDPFSILISENVEIGTGNIFYPNVILEANRGGSLILGSSNIFYPGAKLLADSGKIVVGDENEFGDGGVRIKANTSDELIEIGNRGRYMSGARLWHSAQSDCASGRSDQWTRKA
jgi:hypothetical protein